MGQAETPAADISSVENPNWQWDAEKGEWVPKAAPPAPPAPPAAPPETGEQGPVGTEGVPGQPAPPPAPPAPQTLPPAPSPQAVAPAAEPKVMSADWPVAGYTGPQPWEAENPPALTQNHLMLSGGSAGPEVVELAALLAYLGYGTTISAGENPHAIYDEGVSAAVRAFCTEYGVQEDPKVRAARTDDTVGPWIWEALVRAVHKKVANDQEQAQA